MLYPFPHLFVMGCRKCVLAPSILPRESSEQPLRIPLSTSCCIIFLFAGRRDIKLPDSDMRPDYVQVV